MAWPTKERLHEQLAPIRNGMNNSVELAFDESPDLREFFHGSAQAFLDDRLSPLGYQGSVIHISEEPSSWGFFGSSNTTRSAQIRVTLPTTAPANPATYSLKNMNPGENGVHVVRYELLARPSALEAAEWAARNIVTGNLARTSYQITRSDGSAFDWWNGGVDRFWRIPLPSMIEPGQFLVLCGERNAQITRPNAENLFDEIVEILEAADEELKESAYVGSLEFTIVDGLGNATTVVPDAVPRDYHR